MRVFLTIILFGCATLSGAHAQPNDPLKILAVGQSNMEGRFGPASQQQSSSDVQAYDLSKKSWLTAQLGYSPFKTLAQNSSEAANNLSYVFAHKVSRIQNSDVKLMLLASGGKRLEYFLPFWLVTRNGWYNNQWSPEFGSSLADEIMGATGPAVSTLEPGEVYDIVLFHQGEANAVEDISEYDDKLRAFIAELDRRNIIGPKTAILVGAINPAYEDADAHKSMITSVAVGDPRIIVVSWVGIEDRAHKAGVSNDSGSGQGLNHATGLGLDELGDRYFVQYMKLKVSLGL